MDCIKNCMQIALNSSVQIKNIKKDGTLVSFADIDIDLAIKKNYLHYILIYLI